MGSGGSRPGAGRKPGAGWKPRVVTGLERFGVDAKKVRARGDSSVYVIGEAHEPDAVKFGLASDARRRLKDLQIGTPRLLKLYAVHMVGSNDDAMALEGAMHERFRSVHIRGEWFRVDIEQAVKALSEEAARLFDLRRNSIRQSEKSNGTWREEGGGGSQADFAHDPYERSGGEGVREGRQDAHGCDARHDEWPHPIR